MAYYEYREGHGLDSRDTKTNLISITGTKIILSVLSTVLYEVLVVYYVIRVSL